MKCKFSRLSFLVIFLFFPTVIAQASTDYPFYTVQPGETLSIIADKFNITVNEIINLNNISNPNLISPGTQLLIPGLQGISGELTTHTIQIGENLNVFSQKYSIPDSILYKMNRLTSPNEVYAGSDLIISISQSKAARIPVMKLSAGQSLAEVSILLNMNPWFLPAIYSEPPLAKVILEDLLYLP